MDCISGAGGSKKISSPVLLRLLSVDEEAYAANSVSLDNAEKSIGKSPSSSSLGNTLSTNDDND